MCVFATSKKMNQIRHKCGYCGWLFRFSTNFIEHECFKCYIEGVDHINVDENYVVTLVKTNPSVTNRNENLNELLIEAVKNKRGLYDFRVPASERTILRKNALWMEVANMLQGSFSPEEAKARWKYLRDNYIKARKKVRAYVPSGSEATAVNIMQNKSKFQYYELMTFLNDSLQTRPTVNSLTDASTNNDEIVTLFDTENEQYDDAIAGPSMLQISASNCSQTSTSSYASLPTPPTKVSQTSSYDPSWTSTPTKALLSESRVPARTRAIGSKSQNYINDYEPPVMKKKKNEAVLQAALIEALKEPATQAIDPLDGIFIRLGEGMRKLPYRDRAQLEIQFLTMLANTEDRCSNRDSNRLT